MITEAINTDTYLDGWIPVKNGGVVQTSCEQQFDVIPPFARALMTWGKVGTVTIKARTSSTKGIGPLNHMCADWI
jgi:hypothetical protein